MKLDYHLPTVLSLQEVQRLLDPTSNLKYKTIFSTMNSSGLRVTADTKYLGAKIGYISILHTWGSQMIYHPHIHAIVLGGGLTAKNKWKDSGDTFFLPIRVISRLLRGNT